MEVDESRLAHRVAIIAARARAVKFSRGGAAHFEFSDVIVTVDFIAPSYVSGLVPL